MMNQKLRIGWIGTGVMGRWMCQHIREKGYEMTVYNRSPEKMAPLLEIGAKLAKSPKEVAENSDVIFSIVGFPKDVREVILGPSGVLAGAKPGSTIVDMTSSEPELAVEIYEAAKKKARSRH
jgi:3-hydroxyisobutyrate dehydrogenase